MRWANRAAFVDVGAIPKHPRAGRCTLGIRDDPPGECHEPAHRERYGADGGCRGRAEGKGLDCVTGRYFPMVPARKSANRD